MKFKDQKVVITGGSTGIGLATAKKYINEGAKVLITGRDSAKLSAAKDELGSNLFVFQSDVSILEDLKGLKHKVTELFGEFDILFANAGIAKNNSMGSTTSQMYDELIDINVKGLFFTVEFLTSILKDGGSIILTSSIVGNKGMPNLSLYNASKAAVRSFSRSWANDFKERGIRVNTLSPGPTQTTIFKNGLNMSDEDISGFNEFLKDSSPIGRMATSDEVADSVLFLSSNEASCINGIELSVDGGFAQI